MHLVLKEIEKEIQRELGRFVESSVLEIAKFTKEKEKEKERMERDGRRKNPQKKNQDLKSLDDLIGAAHREIRNRILAEHEVERRKQSKKMFDRWIQNAISRRK